MFFSHQKQEQTGKRSSKYKSSKVSCQFFNSDAVIPNSLYLYICIHDFINTKDNQIYPLNNFALYIMSDAFRCVFFDIQTIKF